MKFLANIFIIKNTYLLIMILIFAGCGQKNNETTELLPKEKMIQVLKDMHIAEADAYLKKYKKDTLQIVLDKQYLFILKRHEVSVQEFNKSFDYLLQNKNELDDVYEKVIDELSKLEGEVAKKIEGQKK